MRHICKPYELENRPLALRISGQQRTIADCDSMVRTAAADAIGHIATKESIAHLKAMLDDKGWVVRAAALDAPGKRDDPSVLKPISAELTDTNTAVRFRAAARLSNDAAKQAQTGASQSTLPPRQISAIDPVAQKSD